eukprot:TRINITY_DN4183_c0_g1_i1.p1 TRINITY_DN4183_c0_g1~~TRINITY_DN4183_c0_g1_i1.p1  ORF type:complete len:102 (-),score=20.22 TRINITY_DN4183_c0_g1_i1:140-445(-)
MATILTHLSKPFVRSKLPARYVRIAKNDYREYVINQDGTYRTRSARNSELADQEAWQEGRWDLEVEDGELQLIMRPFQSETSHRLPVDFLINSDNFMRLQL